MGSFYPISKAGILIPANGLTFALESSSNTALPVAGAGVAADSLTQQVSDINAGTFLFSMPEGTGLELQFAITDNTGETATFRVFREIALVATPNASPSQFTYRHLCDLTVAASTAQAGIASGSVLNTAYWGVPTITSEAGLSPNGTRVMQGTTAGAAGSVIVDPVCAGRIMVVGKIGTAAGFRVFAQAWTGM